VIALLLTVLAGRSMLYGNLIALVQTRLQAPARLLRHRPRRLCAGRFRRAHRRRLRRRALLHHRLPDHGAGVLHGDLQVSRDGTNVAIAELAGLHRRSPLLATTLIVGVFGLAGIPPFVGFMGKLACSPPPSDQGPPAAGRSDDAQRRHRDLLLPPRRPEWTQQPRRQEKEGGHQGEEGFHDGADDAEGDREQPQQGPDQQDQQRKWPAEDQEE
jgi:hypothetical protein